MTPGLVAAGLSQLALLLLGLYVCWRLFFAPSRAPGPVVRLPAWDITWFDFGVICLAVMGGGLVGQLTLGVVLRRLTGGLDPDLQLLVQGGAFQAGLLLGVFAGVLITRGRTPSPPPVSSPPPRLPAGGAAFVAALPVLFLVSWGWTFLLERLGFPTDKQELVELFARTESPAVIVLVSFMAIIVAPVAEEVIFRAGLFRFLRTRVPRFVALALPAVIFAGLHGNLAAFAPLVVLGIAFALAYERTGRIAVPIIAHALFNLNTILLLLAGVTV